jgi:hypothetical protein
VPALIAEYMAQVIENRCGLGVTGTADLSSCFQALAEESFGFAVFFLVLQDCAQIVDCRENVGVPVPLEMPVIDEQSTIESLGLGILAGAEENITDVKERRIDHVLIRFRYSLSIRETESVECFSLIETPLCPEEVGKVFG